MKLFSEDKLIKILRAAYFEKEKIEIDHRWQANVMRHIRNLRSDDNVILIEKMLWRFALVACTIVLILGAVTLRSDMTTEYEIAESFIDNPIAFEITQYLGTI